MRARHRADETPWAGIEDPGFARNLDAAAPCVRTDKAGGLGGFRRRDLRFGGEIDSVTPRGNSSGSVRPTQRTNATTPAAAEATAIIASFAREISIASYCGGSGAGTALRMGFSDCRYAKPLSGRRRSARRRRTQGIGGSTGLPTPRCLPVGLVLMNWSAGRWQGQFAASGVRFAVLDEVTLPIVSLARRPASIGP